MTSEPDTKSCLTAGKLFDHVLLQEVWCHRILMWEALNLIPSRARDFQFFPVDTTYHAVRDGTCGNPTRQTESLAAREVVIAEKGPVSFGPLTGVHQCIQRAELTAVISALWWIKGHVGSLHIWCDNQVVVDHFRDIQRGVAEVSSFAHADLWIQVRTLINDAAAEL